MDDNWYKECQKRRAEVEAWNQKCDAAFAKYYTCGHCANTCRNDNKELICEVINKKVGLDDPACNSVKLGGFHAFQM